MKNEMNNGANAQVNAGNASVNANARTLHSAYDKDLLALFDKTAEHELDVHTTLVDVRRMCPKGTALRKLFDEKWGEIFKTALTYMPCAICEDGRIIVGKWVDAREGLAELVIADKKRKIVSYRYKIDEDIVPVSEGMSTLVIMHDEKVPETTTHVNEDGHPYVVTLKRMDEHGKMVAVYRTENKKRVFVPFDKYGFSSVVRKALRAAVDAVAGVVEPQKKSAK